MFDKGVIEIDKTFTCIGASNYSDQPRSRLDYYATEPKATVLLLEKENFTNVLEPACGEGHMSKVLVNHGIDVTSYDIMDRGYGGVADFFKIKEWNGDIVTNPPYGMAQKFVEHALEIVPEGRKVAMFLRVLFLEGICRRKLFDTQPPKTVYVASKRLQCARNGKFSERKHSGAMAFAWYVWEKGFKGTPTLAWIN